MGPSKESLSLLYKFFLRPLLTYASPGWFPFLSVTIFTKLERLNRAANRTISGCLSSSLIPLLLSETSLPLLRIILTHFALSSYEWVLRSQPPFPFQVWLDLERNQDSTDLPGELCVHSSGHSFFYFS